MVSFKWDGKYAIDSISSVGEKNQGVTLLRSNLIAALAWKNPKIVLLSTTLLIPTKTCRAGAKTAFTWIRYRTGQLYRLCVISAYISSVVRSLGNGRSDGDAHSILTWYLLLRLGWHTNVQRVGNSRASLLVQTAPAPFTRKWSTQDGKPYPFGAPLSGSSPRAEWASSAWCVEDPGGACAVIEVRLSYYKAPAIVGVLYFVFLNDVLLRCFFRGFYFCIINSFFALRLFLFWSGWRVFKVVS